MSSCCCFQAERRASRGWVEAVEGAPVALGAGAERFRLWRRVSWTPGAEGAPRLAGVVFVVVLVGMMRRDWEGDVLVWEGVLFGGGEGTYHDVLLVVALEAADLRGLFLRRWIVG
jgi:hypothetical protein